MKHLPAISGLVTLYLATALSAAELNVSVPEDLAHYFVGGGRMYGELPADFPAFDMADGLSVIGSHDRDRQQLVLLRSYLGGAEAQQAIVDDLLARGWIDLTPSAQDYRYGFITPAVNLVPARLCHDELGNLEVRGEDGVENRVYMRRNITSSPSANSLSCEEQLLSRRTGRPSRTDSGADLLRYVPSLQPPGSPPFTPNIGVFGRIGQDFETGMTVYVPDSSAGEVNTHYAGQLREQGWQLDASWEEDDNAGGNWTRRTEDDLRLFLSLQVLPSNENTYAIKLYLQQLE